MNKHKKAIIKKAIKALLCAAKAQDELAKAYRAMRWDLAATTAECDAQEMRARAKRISPDSILWK